LEQLPEKIQKLVNQPFVDLLLNERLRSKAGVPPFKAKLERVINQALTEVEAVMAQRTPPADTESKPRKRAQFKPLRLPRT
jgi:hypothetical protein